MKITFEEVISRSNSLQQELLSSLTNEVFTEKAIQDRFYDVKLLVNGIELEPVLFNDIMTKIETFIEGEAKKMVREKFESAMNKASEIEGLIETLKENIIENI